MHRDQSGKQETANDRLPLIFRLPLSVFVQDLEPIPEPYNPLPSPLH
jgi:hypothetical protein